MRRDHPRGCGENDKLGGEAFDTLGSPPRMRGKLCLRINYWQVLRITPADAGKTDGFLKEIRPVEDHPRGCGENTPSFSAALLMMGSPPRMRGKQ